MLKINLFIEEEMQTNITAKLKISKLQKNNPIKLLAATIALSASLSAMDPSTTFVDDDEAKSASSRGGSKFSQSNGQNNKNQGKGKASLKAAKIVEQTQKTTNPLGDEEELVSTKERAKSEPNEIKEEADSSEDTAEKPQVVEKDKSDLEDIVKNEKEEVIIEEGFHQNEPKESIESAEVLDDLVKTLTGGGKETDDAPYVRGNKPTDRGSQENSESSGIKGASSSASSATVKCQNKSPAVSVVVGWGVFLGQSTVSAISYLTPDFVKSFYGNVTTFFGNIRDICSRIRAPKK